MIFIFNKCEDFLWILVLFMLEWFFILEYKKGWVWILEKSFWSFLCNLDNWGFGIWIFCLLILEV